MAGCCNGDLLFFVAKILPIVDKAAEQYFVYYHVNV